MINPKSHEQITLREDILKTLRYIQRQGDSLDCSAALEHVYQTAHEGSDASYLRNEYAERGGVEGIVDSALERFRHSASRLA